MRRILPIFALVAVLLTFARPAAAAAPPSGTTVELYADGRDFPVAMAFAPDGRLFYTEKGGFSANSTPSVRTLSGQPGAVTETEWLQLSGVDATGERGLLGIALDPDFATNGYVYLFYTNQNPLANRVVRYTEDRTNPANPVGDPGSAFVLMQFNIPGGSGNNHNGGNIHFGPDGYLYITHGELGAFRNEAQQLNSELGKIHRIDVRAPYNAEPNAARAPEENPYYDDGNPETGNEDRIWTYGHRNSFDFTFDTYDPAGSETVSNFLFATENGPECDDEILRIVEGYNYRWPLDSSCNGTPPEDATGPNPDDPAIPTLAYYEETIAPTGIVIYDGDITAWQGDLFFCASNTNLLYHAELNAARDAFTAVPEAVDDVSCSLDVENGPDGALYFSTGSAIYRARSTVPTAVTMGTIESNAPSGNTASGIALALGLVAGAVALGAWRRR